MFQAGAKNALLVRLARGSGDGHLVVDEHVGGSALQRERWHGTLELLVAAPSHFSLVLLPMTIAMSTIGLYSMAATLFWGRVLFGIHVHIEHSAALLPVGRRHRGLDRARSASCWRSRSSATGPRGRSGTCSSTRSGSICGFLVPLDLFPGWVRPISWVLAADWGMNAIRESADGGTPLPDAAICAGLGLVYLTIGVLVSDYVLAAARKRATGSWR